MILVVVCHPDDEALWFGGTIHGLNTSAHAEVAVICLSGRDSQSPREAEFASAMALAGCKRSVVLGYPLRPATQPLPPVAPTIAEGLAALGRTRDDVDIVITHPPYGDEHLNPHHKQAFNETLAWARGHRIPMGFFSNIPLPVGKMKSLLKNNRRMGALHLSFLGKCSYGMIDRLRVLLFHGRGWMPQYYVQFQTDLAVKTAMLEQYVSVGIEEHRAGYSMFTSGVEAFYIFDRRGFRVIGNILNAFDVPGPVDLTWQQFRPLGFAYKIVRGFRRALHS